MWIQIYLGQHIWQIQVQIYLVWNFLANTNMNIFWFLFLGINKYIWTFQKGANINTNIIIQTDICKYEYKCKYYTTQNLIKIKKIYLFMDIKALSSLQIQVHLCCKKWQIQIRIFKLLFANTNRIIWIGICEYKYKHSSHTDLDLKSRK